MPKYMISSYYFYLIRIIVYTLIKAVGIYSDDIRIELDVEK